MIYLTISTPQSVCLQMTVSCTTKWEHDWQMHFNPNKRFVMRLTHARNVKQCNYTLRNTILKETDSHSYLGVCITKDLKNCVISGFALSVITSHHLVYELQVLHNFARRHSWRREAETRGGHIPSELAKITLRIL